MNCPKCNTKMFGNTILSTKPFKHYQECPKCGYRSAAK